MCGAPHFANNYETWTLLQMTSLEDSIMIIFNYVIENILFSVFFSFQNLPILKDSIMIIFNYVIANFLFSFFYFKISQYFKTSQFWKIQSWSFLTMSLKTFYFRFSILKSPYFKRLNIFKCVIEKFYLPFFNDELKEAFKNEKQILTLFIFYSSLRGWVLKMLLK